VLSQLKADPATADIPVVLVTIAEGAELGYALGAAEYLTKPVEVGQLREVVERQLQGRATGRVLVVEDEDATRAMVSQTLVKAGLAVDVAANGIAALERIGEGRPDVVVLDLLMPEMDGFELIERLRSDPSTRELPVLVMTAKDLTGEERTQLSGRVSSILAKGSTSRRDLLSMVQRLLSARPVAARPVARSSAP
jgi:CheY-like chemotaxis protein